MAIIAKYTLPVSNVLLVDFITALPMLTPTEMTVKILQAMAEALL